MTLAPQINMALSQLITNAIVDERVLAAITTTRREDFMPPTLKHCAYVDDELEVAPGRFQMAPLTFARLIELAGITPECRMLTVGCLSGYSAAVLSRLAQSVVATDEDAAMCELARKNLSRLGVANVEVEHVSSHALGFEARAPYDVILIEGAVEFIPESLGLQLSVSGRMVAVRNVQKRPGDVGGLGRGLLVKRINQSLQLREYFDASGALLCGFENRGGFRF